MNYVIFLPTFTIVYGFLSFFLLFYITYHMGFFLSSILYYLPRSKELTDNFNFQILFREDATVDDFIDVIEGNRKYMKCVYVYNKIDVVGIDDVDRLSRQPNSIVISCNLKVAAYFHLSVSTE